MAHLSNRPFGDSGLWGSPWRHNREFVGRVAYGVRWKMWSPEVHMQFPYGKAHATTTKAITCQSHRHHITPSRYKVTTGSNRGSITHS